MARIQNRTFSISSGGVFVEEFSIDALEDAAQQVVLSRTPSRPLEVTLSVSSGPDQRNGFDFEVTGAVVSWAGKALETLLSEGDNIIIQYVV